MAESRRAGTIRLDRVRACRSPAGPSPYGPAVHSPHSNRVTASADPIRARNFRQRLARIRSCLVRRSRRPAKPKHFPHFAATRDWPGSCPPTDEKVVIRAAVLSIVLTLAVGPSANLLCSVWCHPEDATNAACEHQNATTSPRVTGEDSCRTTPTTAAAFTRDEAKRGSSPNGDQQAAVARTLRLADPLTEAIQPREGRGSLATAVSPVLIALRI